MQIVNLGSINPQSWACAKKCGKMCARACKTWKCLKPKVGAAIFAVNSATALAAQWAKYA